LFALIGISVFSWIWTKLGILMVRKSSRENEFEADRFAASCGYADDLIAALDHLAEAQEDGEDDKGLFNQLSKTHPDLDTRIAKLQEITNTYVQSPTTQNEDSL
jgi:heat shock protein HtpX